MGKWLSRDNLAVHEAEGISYVVERTSGASDIPREHVDFIFLDVFNGSDEVPAAFTEAGDKSSAQEPMQQHRLLCKA